MGLPLSRFRMMAELCSGDEYVRKKFSRYKAVCIILHDPDDEVFKQRMKERFLALHERTGKNMLFISFVDPPNAWMDDDFHLDFHKIESRHLYAERFDDRLLVDNFVRKVAPDASLPLILVSDNLLSPHYLTIGTSVDAFERQLIEISAFCSQTDGPVSINDGRFLEMLSHFGQARFTTLSSRSLALELTDMFAIQQIDNDNDRQAKGWAKNRLLEMELDMENSEDTRSATIAYLNYKSGMERMRKKERERNLIGGACRTTSMENRPVRSPRSEGIRIIRPPSFFKTYRIDTASIRGFNLCDYISKNDLDQFNAQLRTFTGRACPTEDEIRYTDTERRIIRNFMPISFYLSEFLEREVNLSLVQQMRSLYGIEMPEYYRRFKRDHNANIPIGRRDKNKSVSVNSCRYPDELVPVMLGQAYYAYKSMCDASAEHRIPNPLGDDFLKNWDAMTFNRNIAGHAQYRPEDIFDYSRFQTLHRAFSNIAMNHLWDMEMIKLQMMGKMVDE